MTKVEAETMFKMEILPGLIRGLESNGIIDKPARRMAWNNFVQALYEDGDITEKQCYSWGHPVWLETCSPKG
jgi:hypothetical protein